MKLSDTQEIEMLLRNNGYRVTKGRISLLFYLKKSHKPLSAKEIQVGTNYTLDKVTLYRALEDFSRSKIIGKVKLQRNVIYYEFLNDDHHHHHIVCEKCGRIEDIKNCNQKNIQKEIINLSKKFKIINSHSLEFFGVCKTCCA